MNESLQTMFGREIHQAKDFWDESQAVAKCAEEILATHKDLYEIGRFPIDHSLYRIHVAFNNVDYLGSLMAAKLAKIYLISRDRDEVFTLEDFYNEITDMLNDNMQVFENAYLFNERKKGKALC